MSNRYIPNSVDGQFIDDLDPYKDHDGIPIPTSEEFDTDEAWKDFQDSLSSNIKQNS